MTRTLEPETRTAEDTLEVVVTLDDIAQGERESSFRCAIARSLRRRYEFVIVGEFVTWAGSSADDCEAYRTPVEMRNWIRRFDDGEPVEPERFVLKRAQSASGITQGSAG